MSVLLAFLIFTGTVMVGTSITLSHAETIADKVLRASWLMNSLAGMPSQEKQFTSVK